jgi:signal transduction histidine kinase
MIKNRGVVDLHKSFERGVQNIFQLACYVILLANIIEIYNFGQKNKYILYSNIPTIVIIIGTLILYYLKKLDYKSGFSILIYSIIANIIMGTFVPEIILFSPDHINFFLRDTLFILLLLTVASFSLHRIHAFIIGGCYLITFLVLFFIVKNKFLNENFIIIFTVISAYIGLIYYLVGMFEKALLEQHEKHIYIKEQNEILNEVNVLLKERQQLIEVQSTELIAQKIELQEKNEELYDLNATKDKFFSIIAHDIKNPFTAIVGFSELLLKNFNKWTDDKKVKTIMMLSESSKNLYELLENLLQWSRSQRGLIDCDPLKLDLNDAVERIITLLKPNADAKEIKIIKNIPDSGLILFADPRLLDVILRNLISNALKFSYKGGQIEIKAEAGEEFVLVSVIDNGIGISADAIDNLFRIDVYNTSIGTNDEKGTGLGLILVKEFVTKLGGSISVISELGKRSEFTFSIPLA